MCRLTMKLATDLMLALSLLLTNYSVVNAANKPLLLAEAEVEELRLKTPPQFKISYQEEGQTISVYELIPQQETADDWTQMISHQVFHNIGDANPNTLMDDILKMFEPVCQTLQQTMYFSGKENGYPTTLRAQQCRDNKHTGESQTVLFKAIQGEQNLHIIQWVYRYPAHFTAPVLSEQLNYLKHATLKSISVEDSSSAVLQAEIGD